MQNIDASELLDFDRELAQILDEMPAERAMLHEEIGEIIKQDVDAAMLSSGLQEKRGEVRRWQIKHIGSGGGYAAVRPQKGKLSANGRGRSYSYGQITNAIVSGHNIRKPEGYKYYRKGRIRVGKVRAFPFYESAHISAEAKVIRKVQEYVDTLSAKVEGK